MTTMNEQMQDRMQERPDAATLAWWREQFFDQAKATRGAIHAMNRTHAEIEDQNATVARMGEYLEKLTKRVADAEATIGKLQAEVTLLKESMEKAREAYSELRKQIAANS